MDGELIPWEQANVHIMTHALHYGFGAFEGIRAYETERGVAIFRLREHVQRLINSAKVLMLDIPFTADEICAAHVELLRANHMGEGTYIRPLVYTGYGEVGIFPLTSPVRLAIATWTWGAYLGEEGAQKGARLMTSSWRRHDPNAMPTAAKATGMYINSGLAKVEAQRSGYDEALMLAPDGKVSECSGENIFIVRQGILFTPTPSQAGALAGITQDSVIRIARDLGYEVRHEPMIRTDIYLADECFMTGTAAEIIPVASLDDRRIGSGELGPITRELQARYAAVVRGRVSEYDHWLTYCG
jgi:branched-chain amino acid aminotransferase